MKLLIMPRDQESQTVFSLSYGQFISWMAVILVASLFAGAALQRVAWVIAPERGLPQARSTPPAQTQGDEQALGRLSSQIGVLQVKLQHLEALSQRLTGLAGLSLNGPQVVSESPVVSLPKLVTGGATAPQLERQVDVLRGRLLQNTDHFGLLDLLLTQRAAPAARLPTTIPLDSFQRLSSTYGWRRHPFLGVPRVHEGLDFAALAGTPILAASGGIVRTATWQNGYGNLVEIDHGEGLLTRYAHARVLLVKVGELVRRGQMIARVGATGLSTGPHLHFEVRQHERALDPRVFLTGGPLVAPWQRTRPFR